MESSSGDDKSDSPTQNGDYGSILGSGSGRLSLESNQPSSVDGNDSISGIETMELSSGDEKSIYPTQNQAYEAVSGSGSGKLSLEFNHSPPFFGSIFGKETESRQETMELSSGDDKSNSPTQNRAHDSVSGNGSEKLRLEVNQSPPFSGNDSISGKETESHQEKMELGSDDDKSNSPTQNRASDSVSGNGSQNLSLEINKPPSILQSIVKKAAAKESSDFSGVKRSKAEKIRKFLGFLLKNITGEEFVVDIAADNLVIVEIGPDKVSVEIGEEDGVEDIDSDVMRNLIANAKNWRTRQEEINWLNQFENSKKRRLEASEKKKAIAFVHDEKPQEDESLFSMALKMIRERNSSMSEKMDLREIRDNTPEIRSSLNSPLITKEDASKISSYCSTENLTVLQLDICGSCTPNYALHNTSSHSLSLPALTAISLTGAFRLSDTELQLLAEAAPLLNSINLSHCSYITSANLIFLATRFESTLKELYLDKCVNVDAIAILPALKKLRALEVLSVAEIPSVNDDFVIGIVESCRGNIKQLLLGSCVKLTDMSVKRVGESCPGLSAIDLSDVVKLTDSTLRYLANGCHLIQKLKLRRNNFSDEAIAAFMEVSGGSLIELSLDGVENVGVQTAISVVKRAGNLRDLDLSFCRRLTAVELNAIVESCLSLRLVKVIGCKEIPDSNSRVQIVG